ncbi:MAG: ATP-dependent DNA helicase, partial [Deltaproteobacteria bacterium]|nr:ATP-dependent DNA helicase [Deltaproteobacteria bacterium]
AARRAAAARDDLALVVEGAGDRVTWLDGNDRGVALSSSPVDVAPILRERLFATLPCSIFTSATLATGAATGSGPFAFVRRRLGADGDATAVEELRVPSPFDYATRALLYVPRDLPPPADPGFHAAAAARAIALTRASDGGAFLLTTSVRSLRQFGRLLRAELGASRVLVQGESAKSALLARFRAAGDLVLVATASFWQGVDVPGDALRLVMLEKLPFPVPTEPLIAARARAVEEAGGRAFTELFVPLAKIALQQGFGRLIRTRDDRGVVALLDERVHRRGYGRDLLAALPPARVTADLAEVERFLAARGT